jgi:hypothetical protein
MLWRLVKHNDNFTLLSIYMYSELLLYILGLTPNSIFRYCVIPLLFIMSFMTVNGTQRVHVQRSSGFCHYNF